MYCEEITDAIFQSFSHRYRVVKSSCHPVCIFQLTRSKAEVLCLLVLVPYSKQALFVSVFFLALCFLLSVVLSSFVLFVDVLQCTVAPGHMLKLSLVLVLSWRRLRCAS